MGNVIGFNTEVVDPRHKITRRDVLQGFIAGIISGLAGGIYPRLQRGVIAPFNEIQYSELLAHLDTLQSEYDEANILLNSIIKKYEIAEVPLPSTTNLAKVILETGNLENGLRFGSSTLSYDDLLQIITGPNSEFREKSNRPPTIDIPPGLPITLADTLFEIYSSLVNKEPGRIATIRVGGENAFSIRGNILITQMGNPLLDQLPSFIHEIVHGTDPSAHYINWEEEFDRYHYSGSEISKALHLDNKWMKFMLNHQDFMQDMIFSAPGDRLAEFLANGDVNRVLHEFKAIATTNLLLNIPFGDENRVNNFPTALNDLEELCLEQLSLTVGGWHQEQESHLDVLRETRERLGRGISTGVRRLLTEKTRSIFEKACGGDVSRFRQGDPGTEPNGFFLNNHTLLGGQEIDWGWEGENSVSVEDYVVIASYSNLLRYYGEVLWPEGRVVFNDKF